jgi:hypothetical protein
VLRLWILEVGLVSLGHRVWDRPGALGQARGSAKSRTRESTTDATAFWRNGLEEGNSVAFERVHRHLTLHQDQQVEVVCAVSWFASVRKCPQPVPEAEGELRFF